MFAEDEAGLLLAAAADGAELAALLTRRTAGVPLEHVLGWAEFCGRRVAVGPGVFVPRRRTALLVHEACALAGSGALAGPGPLVVVDLCCGSGAVGAALAAALAPRVELYAADLDPRAVACARRNVPDPSRVLHGDLYAPLPGALRDRVDLLVVNAPYVPTAAIALLPPEARTHEPAVALDGGPDGLDVQRRVAAGATTWLSPGGSLLVETSDRQAGDTLAAVRGAGLRARVARDDGLDATVVVGTRAAGP